MESGQFRSTNTENQTQVGSFWVKQNFSSSTIKGNNFLHASPLFIVKLILF